MRRRGARIGGTETGTHAERLLGVLNGVPRRRQVEEHRVNGVLHREPVLAHVPVGERDDAVHPVRGKFFSGGRA